MPDASSHRRRAGYLGGIAAGLAGLAIVGCLAPHALWAAQEVAQAAGEGPDVRTFFGISPRKVIWVVAQLHLLFAAFVVGVPWFTVIVEFIGWRKGDPKYDRLAHEFARLFSAAFATTAALGGLLTFTLIGLYPRFSHYFFGIFAPVMYVYGGIFLAETAVLYLYYSTWERLRDRKPLHLALGASADRRGHRDRVHRQLDVFLHDGADRRERVRRRSSERPGRRSTIRCGFRSSSTACSAT